MTHPARLATWLGHRWCGLTTGHRYIRHPDPWRRLLVCWDCSHESTGVGVTRAGRERGSQTGFTSTAPASSTTERWFAMVISVLGLLLVSALVLTLVHAAGKAPLWPAVLVVVVAELLHVGVPR